MRGDAWRQWIDRLWDVCTAGHATAVANLGGAIVRRSGAVFCELVDRFAASVSTTVEHFQHVNERKHLCAHFGDPTVKCREISMPPIFQNYYEKIKVRAGLRNFWKHILNLY